ncbi:leucine-rich repeat receptor-like protein kinase family protein [Striga asiatica]|uniref:Leucine-rich repeat receptor-like protein kinase family protein n=1 Tax=Striga asiatica TaxID=4170 RepID=A0A5A7P1I0_STRAF|nr:leucine-rich repeat receptor-like protein kinase family protein [Striga asiatica]
MGLTRYRHWVASQAPNQISAAGEASPAATAAGRRAVGLNLSDYSLSFPMTDSHALFCNLSYLDTLLIFSNLRLDRNLTGPVPARLGPNLRLLHIGDNDLTEPIPRELAGCSSLVVFTTSLNCLNGSIPDELDDLSSLQILNLANNKLSGEILSRLGQMSELQYLNLLDPVEAILDSLHRNDAEVLRAGDVGRKFSTFTFSLKEIDRFVGLNQDEGWETNDFYLFFLYCCHVIL